ncbi:2-amino-4-hydroxy-6-hydroxymethyldihydropteridine diphosphokinase [Listeria sp. FSL L7-1517]|uniref:2-amino-4-hydroxy-6- hydroxymethyldihydropteridine diphosphokinase n=1 Tax=Listeria immobilis TaxID=2713502 RepID=UPI00164E63F0|nr:2-amino-4-hydroxy-6-hydroxymethyldihydropteridine diphosphokinase [Listeria immobilis]MBC6298362.1 2-amino-4-hydroxy-6-hydroxymethyldihydropteridine diphosphokinase [Listeria immobilis]
MAKAFLSIGTNIGERLDNLNNAVSGLAEAEQIGIVKVSSVYETDAVGFEDQAAFLNIVIEIETSFAPVELLDFCLKLELELGRVRLFKWGPRLIDIDILLYDDVKMDTKKLKIPHPYMKERAFVMIPLVEISPDKASIHVNHAVLAEQGVRKTKKQVKW